MASAAYNKNSAMQNWLRNLHRGVRYRVTRGGFLFTLAVALIGSAAVASANNLLFLVVATMLSVGLISGLVSRLGLSGLEIDFVLPEHVSVGRPVAAILAVRNVKLWMPSFSVRITGAVDELADAPPILTSAVYFSDDPCARHTRGDGGAAFFTPRRASPESIRVQYSLSVRLPRKDGGRFPAQRCCGLSFRRGKGRFRRSVYRNQR